ncbi:MAG: thymidine kinase [Clostridia bacterium]|nr:thymidine kinase [Clostridia bacterium]
MAKLYFRYGAMGSSKTANAIMVQYNYLERGQSALLIKPMLDSRDGAHTVGSRSGLTAPCRYVEELDDIDLKAYDCVIVDEAQFLKKEQVQRLVDIVDEMDIPVICYGLRADFQGNLFEGSHWLMAWADTIEEIKTVCWCGRKATMNARVMGGKVVKSGEQIVLGGNESYVALCRRHWAKGELAPLEIRRIAAGKEDYMPLLLDADPSERLVRDYLDAGELYALFVDGKPVGEMVLVARWDGEMELKNLAVSEGQRGRGYGAALVRHAFQLCAPRGERLYVGTSPANVAFYEKLGFEPAYVAENFFVDNYDAPIIEDGRPLKDMQYLVRSL